MVAYMMWLRDGTVLKLAADGTVLARTWCGRWMDLAGGWRIIGLRQRGRFNHPGPLIPLADAARLRDFSYGNGTARYYMQDNDHGGNRLMMSPGLRDLRAV